MKYLEIMSTIIYIFIFITIFKADSIFKAENAPFLQFFYGIRNNLSLIITSCISVDKFT